MIDINVKNTYPLDKNNVFSVSLTILFTVSSMLLNVVVNQFEIGFINTIIGRFKAVHTINNAKMDL
jgi:hypothetical protein